MLNKSYSKTGRVCRVTFEHRPETDAGAVALVGEFNGWNPKATPMKRRKDGRYSVTISMNSGKDYRFRYLLNGERWENDSEADAYAPNDFGTDDCVVNV